MRISCIISAISLLAWITSCDNTIENPVSESSGIMAVLSSQPTEPLVPTIRKDLQAYADNLMKQKKGALVAIEPTTGEILCMSPLPKDGEPSLTVSDKYSPGGLLDPVSALCYLQDGVITSKSRLCCDFGFEVDSFRMGCFHGSNTDLDVKGAIACSCNGFFGSAFYRFMRSKKRHDISASLDLWNEHLRMFGLGSKVGADVPDENAGFIPDHLYYDSVYADNGPWKAPWVLSLALGQGELLVTPLQMANVAAAFFNRGYYMTPHMYKNSSCIVEKHVLPFDSAAIQIVCDGMRLSATRGNLRRNRLDKEGIELYGMSTAIQRYSGRDNSGNISFAAKDGRSIAVCCIIDHGGFGASIASPLATCVIEKYLNDTISSRNSLKECRVLEYTSNNQINMIYN